MGRDLGHISFAMSQFFEMYFIHIDLLLPVSNSHLSLE